jgi:Flp pilus assembly pilin Flp
MNNLLCHMRTFRMDRRAVTALEYAIIASALGVALLAIFAKLATPISAILSGIGGSI